MLMSFSWIVRLGTYPPLLDDNTASSKQSQCAGCISFHIIHTFSGIKVISVSAAGSHFIEQCIFEIADSNQLQDPQ